MQQEYRCPLMLGHQHMECCQGGVMLLLNNPEALKVQSLAILHLVCMEAWERQPPSCDWRLRKLGALGA